MDNKYTVKKLLREGLLLFSIFVLLTIAAVLFIDKPLALIIYKNEWDKLSFLKYISEYPHITVVGISLLFIIFSKSNSVFCNKLTLIIYIFLLVSLSAFIKTFLKIIFGRYWPLSWKGNLSLIDNGVFGFNWLCGFNNNGSFPSGHLTFVSVISFTLFITYSKFKLLAYLFILTTLCAQVVLNYHFLGDALSGISLGCLCAYIGLALYLKVKQLF